MAAVFLCYHLFLWISLTNAVSRLLIDDNDHDLLITRRRLVKDTIANFNGNNAYLKRVALFSYKNAMNAADSYCTGGLVTPPQGVIGEFVLIAAHCLYNRRGQTFKDKQNILVEFGITGGAARRSQIYCDVEEIIVHDKWPLSAAYMRKAYDFGIAKLNCQGGQISNNMRFTITDFTNENNGQQFTRAGYEGTRILKTSVQTRVKNPAEKKENKLGYADALIHTGEGDPGDSGGPIFDINGNHDIRAIYTGQPAVRNIQIRKRHHAVKITRANHQIIDNMIKGLDGISSNFIPIEPGEGAGPSNRCQDWSNQYMTSATCWGDCLYEHDEECYATQWTERPYAKPERVYGCVKGKTRKLCGSIPNCSDRNAHDHKNCMGACVAANANANERCPQHRAVNQGNRYRDCTANGINSGHSYICYAKGHNAVPDCSNAPLVANQCWSECSHKHELCWESNQGSRDYHMERGRPVEKYCGKTDAAKTSRYLCGNLRLCVDSFGRTNEIPTRKCWGKCKDANHKGESCVNERSLNNPENSKPCNRGNGRHYLCGAVP